MTQSTEAGGLKFTAAERGILEAMALRRSAETGRPFEVNACAEDGDEWALIAEPEGMADGDSRAVSIQLTGEPGRRCVALGADGRLELAAGDELAAVLRAACTAAAG